MEEKNDLVFNVMPQGGVPKNPPTPGQPPPQIPTPASAPSLNTPTPTITTTPGPSVTYHSPNNAKKWIYTAVGVLVFLALGAAAYYMLGSKKTEQQQTSDTKLPKVWLKQYFSMETCMDQSTCGEVADPDTDGLGNRDEFKSGTNPLNPDSDLDGLADGDEVNVYGTEPTLKYTDRREIVAKNDWTDSFQIKNGYDPLTPGLKFTDVRKKKIKDLISSYELHEPSEDLSIPVGTSPAPTPPTTTPPSPSPSPTPPTTSFNETAEATIVANAFSPVTITVNKGDTIVWTNKDGVAHTVTSDTKLFESANLATNQTFSFTFKNSGTFAYHCALHPNMKATVVVK